MRQHARHVAEMTVRVCPAPVAPVIDNKSIWFCQLTEKLGRLDKLFLLGQVDKDDGLDLAAVRRVAEDAKASEQRRNNEHDARQSAGKLFRLLHGLGNGDNAGWGLVRVGGIILPDSQTNALKGKDGGADEQGKVVAVEHDDILGNTVVGQD